MISLLGLGAKVSLKKLLSILNCHWYTLITAGRFGYFIAGGTVHWVILVSCFSGSAGTTALFIITRWLKSLLMKTKNAALPGRIHFSGLLHSKYLCDDYAEVYFRTGDLDKSHFFFNKKAIAVSNNELKSRDTHLVRDFLLSRRHISGTRKRYFQGR